MDRSSCSKCFQTFSRNHDLSRHLKQFHPSIHQGVSPATAMYVTDSSHTFTFQHPFTTILAGPSSSGKTTLLCKILESKRQMIAPSPKVVIWYYKRWQPAYDELLKSVPGIEFIEGMPSPPSFCEQPTLYILDDLMCDAAGSDTVCNLFIEGSHHLNISVFYLMQNAFFKSKHNRSMQINTSYLILFKNPRNSVQPAILARDMFPLKWREFMAKYQEATSRPYGYILIDFKQETPNNQRIVTSLFGDANKTVKPLVDDVNEPLMDDADDIATATSLASSATTTDVSSSPQQEQQTVVPWISTSRVYNPKHSKRGKHDKHDDTTSMRGDGLKAYKKFLSMLSELPLQQIKVLVSHLNRGQLSALREVFTNILAGNVKLTAEQKRLLTPYKTFIRNFAHSSMKRCMLNLQLLKSILGSVQG